MKNTLLFLTVLLAPAAVFALGEGHTPPVPEGATVLHFSEQGRKTVPQDKVRATIRIEHEADTTREVQDVINKAMKKALAQTKGQKSLKAETGYYNVHRRDRWEEVSPFGSKKRKRITKWFGSQSLTLDGKDAEVLTEVVGKLQDEGFQVSQLTYYLSKEKQESLRDELVAQAIGRIQNRAKAIGQQLNLSEVHFAEISFDVNHAQPSPVFHGKRMMMAMDTAESAVAAPTVAAGETDVAITVSARVYLSR